MPNSNTFLRSLTTGAQSVCLEKFDLAKTTLGASNATVLTTGKEITRVFDGLANPDVWEKPINTDGDPINDSILALSSLGADKVPQIISQIRSLLTLLDQKILQPGLAASRQAAIGAPPPSGMNIQVLSALSRTRQQAALRLFQFAQAGQDLQQDPDFKTMQARQDQLVDTYREKLKTNAIASKITDVNNIRQRGEFMASAFNSVTFILHYNVLSNFIQGKLNGA